MDPAALFGLSFRTLRGSEPAPLLAQMEGHEFAPVLAAAGAPTAAAALARLAEGDGLGRSLTLVASDRSGRVMGLIGVRDYPGIAGTLEPLMLLRPLSRGGEALSEIAQRIVWTLATETAGRPLVLSAAREDRPALEAMLALVGDVEISLMREDWRGRDAVVCVMERMPGRLEPLRGADRSALERVVAAEKMIRMIRRDAPSGAGASGGGRRAPAKVGRAPRPAPVPQRPQPQSPSRAGARRPAPAPAATVMTQEGFERLREELRSLTGPGREEIAERLRAAREGGSSADDVEWEDAREAQMELESRIARLEGDLGSARVVRPEDVATDVIGIGVRVTLHGEGRSFGYTLVSASEASPNDGRLSVESPLGAALIGRRAGEEVSVQTPRGARRYMIASVSAPAAAA